MMWHLTSECNRLGVKKGKAFPRGGVLLGGTSTAINVCNLYIKSFCIIIMMMPRVSVSPQQTVH